MPDKRKKQKNTAQGNVGRPIEELPGLTPEGSALLNGMAAELGWPAGVEGIEIEFPRSHERVRPVDLADGKDRPASRLRKID
jgi:hypothetical protein